MQLIHFPGLNCYHDCIITLAGYAGLPYLHALSRLWSEWDLRYDLIGRVFLTRRMPHTLQSMGLTLDVPCVTPETRTDRWAGIPTGAFALVGMDAMQIPWTPLYQLQHGPHYFIVQKCAGDSQCCFDATYQIQGQTRPVSQLLSDAYALIPVRIVKKPLASFAPPTTLSSQARAVLEGHQRGLHAFFARAEVWLQGDGDSALNPAKFVDALFSARLMYRHFLAESCRALEQAPLFASQDYFSQWKTVKNGFYKAALRRQDPAVFGEACRRLSALLEAEQDLAAHILETAPQK